VIRFSETILAKAMFKENPAILINNITDGRAIMYNDIPSFPSSLVRTILLNKLSPLTSRLQIIKIIVFLTREFFSLNIFFFILNNMFIVIINMK